MDYLFSSESFEKKCRSLINCRVKTRMDFTNKSIDEIEAEFFLQSRQLDLQIKRIATVTSIT